MPRAGGEPLRLLLDADLSSHMLVRLLTDRGHDVVAAGLVDTLKQLDDPILFAIAQEQRRIYVRPLRDYAYLFRQALAELPVLENRIEDLKTNIAAKKEKKAPGVIAP